LGRGLGQEIFILVIQKKKFVVQWFSFDMFDMGWEKEGKCSKQTAETEQGGLSQKNDDKEWHSTTGKKTKKARKQNLKRKKLQNRWDDGNL